MSGSSSGRRRGNGDPLLASVNNESSPAQETYQRQPKFTRQLYRETRRRGHRRQQWNARGDCFLHNLEPAAPADQQGVAAERQSAAEERPTDDLVHRVVPAYIFAQNEQFAAGSEKRCGVKAAGPSKDGLRLAQNRRQLAKYFGIERRT
jgi:hypothetical protein